MTQLLGDMSSSPPDDPNQTATAVPTLRSIENALKLVDSKKEDLKKAYDHLLSFPSYSSLLPFSWAQVDSHFSSLHHSVSSRFFLLLNSYDPNLNPGAPFHQDATRTTSPYNGKDPTPGNPDSDCNYAVPAPGIHRNVTERLTRVCERMDGMGLRRYVKENAQDSSFIRNDVSGCLGRIRDPAGLVLDAVEGFGSLRNLEKKACLLILEALVSAKPAGGFNGEARERAKKFWVEWFGTVNLKLGPSADALALLNLVAAFGLAMEVDAAKLIACCQAVSRHPTAPALVKEIGLDDSATASFIEKLMEEERGFVAVKFICELGVADKFRPVDILTTSLNKLKKHRNKSCKEGKHPVSTMNHIRSREIITLESAIKIIDQYKLPSHRETLVKRIAQLKKQNKDERRALSPDKYFGKQKELEKNQETLSQNGNKRPRTMVRTGHVPSSNAWCPPLPQGEFPGAIQTGRYQIPTDAARVHLHPRPPYMTPLG